MREQYVNQICTLLGTVMEVHDGLREKFEDLDSYKIPFSDFGDWMFDSGDKRGFEYSLNMLGTSEKKFLEIKSTFERELHDRDVYCLEDLDGMIQDLLVTLSRLDQPVTFNYLEQLPAREGFDDNSSYDDHVTHFKSALKMDALKTLEGNLNVLNQKENEYKGKYGDNGDILTYLDQKLVRYREIEENIKSRKNDIYLIEYSRNYAAQNVYGGVDYQQIRSEHTETRLAELRSELERLEQAKTGLLNEKPEIALFRKRFDGGEGNQAILEELTKGFERAREAIEDTRVKIINDDLPLEAMAPVVERVKYQLGILPEGEDENDPYSQNVNKWLRRRTNWDMAIKIGGTVVSLATVALLFCTGIGAGVAIGIGAAGAAVGAGTSVYNFERADDLRDAALAQRGSEGELIDDPEAVLNEYAWAVVDLVLCGVDIAGVAGDVAKVTRFVNYFDDAKAGSKVVLQMSDLSDETARGAARVFNELDVASQRELADNLTVGFNKIDDGLKFVNGMADVNKAQVLERINAASYRVIDEIADVENAVAFVNRIDEVPNGLQVLNRLEDASGNTTEVVVRFYTTLDEDVVEVGVRVFNQFDRADDFVDAIGDVERTYYEGTKKVRATGEIRDLSRDVYQRSDIDWDLEVPGQGMTNLEWALEGNAPRGIDGKPLELHHFTQEEPGTMIEMLYTKHKGYHDDLHGLIPDGDSFRNDDILKLDYKSFFSKYWTSRAEEVQRLRSLGK